VRAREHGAEYTPAHMSNLRRSAGASITVFNVRCSRRFKQIRAVVRYTRYTPQMSSEANREFAAR
jgi:hypothetical protein